jgi:Ca2+-binding EF-hand superfamily protein
MDDNLDEKLQSAELRGKLADQVRPEFAKLDTNSDGGLDLTELAPVMQAMGSRGRGASQ